MMLIILQSVLAVFGFYLLQKKKKKIEYDNQYVKPNYKIIGIVVTLFVIFGIPTIVITYDLSFSKIFIFFQYLIVLVQIFAILVLLIRNKKALSK